MFTVVATIFQQIMTEPKGAELEEARILSITETVSKLMKQNGLLTNDYADKYNCKYRLHVLLTINATNSTPAVSSDRAPYIAKTATV
jgi:hypothetical protein